ncbi:MAG: C39 family peptidase, partial [Candidatus Buchananbacteria bacterium]
MKKKLVMFVLVLCLMTPLAFGQGQCVTLDVPYIHQVLDMDQTKFFGHNACGPTSAVTILTHYGLLPPNTSGYSGYYVYTGYSGCTDYSGVAYTTHTAMDMDSHLNHIHSVVGAHGFTVDDVYGDGSYWATNMEDLRIYLQNHGLDVSGWIQPAVRSDLMPTIQTEVNAGRPLIGHVTITIGTKNYGHYLVITGIASPTQIVVNDPYGDYNARWNGTTIGKNVVYDINAVKLDRVITIKPRSDLVGWSLENRTTNQKFVDCWNQHGGEAGVGWVHNDGASGYVHQWSPWNYDCQNFRNAQSQESAIIYGAPFTSQAYLISGAVWEYYRQGYNGRFGPDILLPNGQKLG